MASELKTPPLHSKRVQAWVYAIMNPLIETLQREVFLLRKGNLSWRFHSRGCEYIRPISGYVEVPQWPNYEDFLTDDQNSFLKADFEEHDRRVGEVESSAARFFDGLLSSAEFLRRVQEALREYESVAPGNAPAPSLGSMRDNLSRVVAELLVNRAESLPHHYTIHRFWENSRRRFEAVEDQFEPHQQRQSFSQTLRKATGALQAISEKLLGDLKSHRQSLCIEYDIPAAPIPVSRGDSANDLTL